MKVKLCLFLFVAVFIFASCGRNNNGDDYAPDTGAEGSGLETQLPGQTEPDIPYDDSETTEYGLAVAMEFMDRFIAGDISGMVSLMDENMLSFDDYMGFWETVHQTQLISHGNFIDYELFTMERNDHGATFQFIARQMTAIVSYNVFVDDDRVGEFFTPSLPAFVHLEGWTPYTMEHVIIGEGTAWPLAGMLTIPEDASAENPVPAVVLVHGSGSHNMDSSIFDNRPFFDIADHLSTNGVAVVRYHKRGWVHGANIMLAHQGGDMTVWHETMEDAILAAELLRADPRIDENRIFIAGLSLGALLAPRIHNLGGDFAGMILMAGSPHNLTDIIIDQNRMAIELIEDELERSIAYSQAAALAEMFAALEDMTPQMARMMPFGGGATFYYLMDLNTHPFDEMVRDVHVPFLILHGSHDFQVRADWVIPAFEEVFAGRENVSIILYEGLNHIFMSSIAQSIDDLFYDYAIPGNVYPQVLEDIVEWILAQ